jgi:hypothetical protein
MAVIVGIIIACALFVTLAATLFTDVKVFGLLREQRRTMPPEARRETMRLFAILTPLEVAYLAFVFVIAPFGRRDTVIWCLIVPFLVLVPLGTIAAGIRAYRLGRHEIASEGDRATLPR